MTSRIISVAVFSTLLISSSVGNASLRQSQLQTRIVFKESEVPQYESSVKEGRVFVRIVSPKLGRKAPTLDSKNGSGSILRY